MSYFGSIYADQDLSHRARTVYMYAKPLTEKQMEDQKTAFRISVN